MEDLRFDKSSFDEKRCREIYRRTGGTNIIVGCCTEALISEAAPQNGETGISRVRWKQHRIG
jgi:hypothetical protein